MMRYIYEVFKNDNTNTRLDTFVRLEQIKKFPEGCRIVAYDQLGKCPKETVATFFNQDDLDMWQDTLAINYQWMDKDTKGAQRKELEKIAEGKIEELNLFLNEIRRQQAMDHAEMQVSVLNVKAKDGTPLSDIIMTNEALKIKAPCDGMTLGQITGKGATASADAYDKTGSAKHYKDTVPGFQYMEMMQYMTRDMSPMVASLFTIIQGYYMRLGKKDDPVQEMIKVLWYTKFLLAYLINKEQPIKIEDIDSIINFELKK